jgi:hypothetical protein
VEGHGQFVSQGPGRRYPQAQASAAAGEAGSDVQQPVAELLRLGSGEFPVQQQDARPGQQIDRREAEFEPDDVDGEVAEGEAAEAGGLAAPDVVLDACMRTAADLQELGGTTPEYGVSVRNT